MISAINGISLAFDLVDTLRWFAGNHEIPKHNASGRSPSC